MKDAKDDEVATSLGSELTNYAKAAQEVENIRIVQSLLGPSAKILGEHFATKLTSWLNPEQNQNLRDHLDAAGASLPAATIQAPTVLQISGLIEWTDAAKDIEKSSSPLRSALLERALVDIFQEEFELTRCVRELTEEDLRELQGDLPLTEALVLKLEEINAVANPIKRSKYRRYGFESADDVIPIVLGVFAFSGGLAALSSVGTNAGYIIPVFLLLVGLGMILSGLMDSIRLIKEFRKFPNSKRYTLTAKGNYLMEKLGSRRRWRMISAGN